MLSLAEAYPPIFLLVRSPVHGCRSPPPPKHTPALERGEVAFASHPGNNKDLFPTSHRDKPSSNGLLEVLSNREYTSLETGNGPMVLGKE